MQAPDSRETLERLYFLEQEEIRRLEDRVAYRFTPNRAQIRVAGEFKEYVEVNLTGGNQLGKTTVAGEVIAINALGDYDEFPWYEGLRVKGDITIICASETLEKTDLVMAGKLFGEYLGRDGTERKRANGLIPKNRIIHTQYAGHHLSRAVVKRADGSRATFLFLAYSMRKERLQSITAHMVWLDEEPSLEIYNEFLARTNATHGPILLTMCPNKGRTPLLAMFNLGTGNRKRIKYGVDDADHLSDEEKQALKDRYKDNPAELPSLYGEEVAGIGLAYPNLRQRALCEPFSIPSHWPRVIGYDIPHTTGQGSTGYFAAVWIALDPASATDHEQMDRYVYRAFKASGMTAADYAAACKSEGRHGDVIPGAMPHDAGRRAQSAGINEGTAQKLREIYLDLDLNIIDQTAGFETDDGKISRDPMLAIEINNILINEGKLKIFDSPATQPLLAECDHYYIDEKQKPAPKQDDHCADAWTKASFMVRYAEPLNEGLHWEVPERKWKEDDPYGLQA